MSSRESILQKFPLFIFFLPRTAAAYRTKFAQLALIHVFVIPFVGFIVLRARPQFFPEFFSFILMEVAALIVFFRSWRGHLGLLELTLLAFVTLISFLLELYIAITSSSGSDLAREIALVVLGTAIMTRFYARGAMLMRAEN